MRTPTLLTLAAITTMNLAGCNNRATPRPPAPAAAPPLSEKPLAPESDRLRAQFASLGVDLPAVRVMFNAGGRRLLGFPVAGRNAIAMWEGLRAATDATGLYPLLVQSDRTSLFDAVFEDPRRPASEILHAAEAIDGDAWLRKRLDAYLNSGGQSRELPRSAWPADTAPLTDYSLPTKLSSDEFPTEVWMLLLPTRSSAEVFAILDYGNWNDYPASAEHVAMHIRWLKKYGAEIVGISSDVIEMRCPRPPTTRDAAIALAIEHFAYCSDIVDQGYGTIDNLAAALLGGRVWYFWWD